VEDVATIAADAVVEIADRVVVAAEEAVTVAEIVRRAAEIARRAAVTAGRAETEAAIEVAIGHEKCRRRVENPTQAILQGEPRGSPFLWFLMVSMPAHHQPMIHPFGLVVIQRRQDGHGGRFGFIEDAFGHRLQRSPAWPVEIGSMGDLPQHAAPLDDDSINITGAEQVADPAGLFSGFLCTDATTCSAPDPYRGGMPFSR
jgi:hypothetical protein